MTYYKAPSFKKLLRSENIEPVRDKKINWILCHMYHAMGKVGDGKVLVYEHGNSELKEGIENFGYKDIDYVNSIDVNPSELPTEKYDLIVSLNSANYYDDEVFFDELSLRCKEDTYVFVIVSLWYDVDNEELDFLYDRKSGKKLISLVDNYGFEFIEDKKDFPYDGEQLIDADTDNKRDNYTYFLMGLQFE